MIVFSSIESISKNLTANPGETFTFTIDVTNNAGGYSSLITWLDIDERYFELVEWMPGDPTVDKYNRTPQASNTTLTKYTKPGSTNLLTLVQMYFDANAENFAGDNVFATVTLKVKEDTPDGVYPLTHLLHPFPLHTKQDISVSTDGSVN